MLKTRAKKAKIDGDIPVNCSKYYKIQGFGHYNGKNSPYF
jgi:hypothetical protein